MTIVDEVTHQIVNEVVPDMIIKLANVENGLNELADQLDSLAGRIKNLEEKEEDE
jgi:hypothetical protein